MAHIWLGATIGVLVHFGIVLVGEELGPKGGERFTLGLIWFVVLGAVVFAPYWAYK